MKLRVLDDGVIWLDRADGARIRIDSIEIEKGPDGYRATIDMARRVSSGDPFVRRSVVLRLERA